MRFGFFAVFQAFFLHVLRYQFETWYIHAVGGVTHQVPVSFQSGLYTLTYFTDKNRSKSFMCIHGFNNYIEASDLVHTQIFSVLTPIVFCHAWAIFGPLVDKNTRKGELMELPASETWALSFIRIRSLPLKSFLAIFQSLTALVNVCHDPIDS